MPVAETSRSRGMFPIEEFLATQDMHCAGPATKEENQFKGDSGGRDVLVCNAYASKQIRGKVPLNLL